MKFQRQDYKELFGFILRYTDKFLILIIFAGDEGFFFSFSIISFLFMHLLIFLLYLMYLLILWFHKFHLLNIILNKKLLKKTPRRISRVFLSEMTIQWIIGCLVQ